MNTQIKQVLPTVGKRVYIVEIVEVYEPMRHEWHVMDKKIVGEWSE